LKRTSNVYEAKQINNTEAFSTWLNQTKQTIND